MNKLYAVTAVDCGDSCDGHPSCLGIFKTEDEAKAYVRNDMEDRCDQLAGTNVQADFDRMEILDECDMPICTWSIDMIEVEIDKNDVIDFCNAAYNDGYNDGYRDGVRHGVAEIEASEWGHL